MEEPLYNKDGILNERRHNDDHEYTYQERRKKQKRDESIEKIKTSTISGIILLLFSGVMTIIGWTIKVFIGRGGH